MWFDIEERIRELLSVKNKLWIYAGPIFGPGNYDTIGNGVQVAPMFFQIIIWEEEPGTPEWEAYMMPHHQKPHGDIQEQRVSIRHIEAMTGLDFLKGMNLGESERVSTY